MGALLSLAFLLITASDPITPGALAEALKSPPKGAEAESLAARVRAAFPPGTDLKSGKAGPLIAGDLVAFVLESKAKVTPRIEGMINHGRGRDMVRIGETPLWAWVETIPEDTKFALRYVAGTRRLGAAVVAMPKWTPAPETQKRPQDANGQYIDVTVKSTVYKNEWPVWIYVPYGHGRGVQAAAVMVLLDGDAYRREEVGTIVDNLIADGSMPPTVLVGINPPTEESGRSVREREYEARDGRLAKFLEADILPLLFEHNVTQDPGARAIVGASSGGLAAFTAAWEHPDSFGRVCCQIGRFTPINGSPPYPELIAAAKKKPLRVVFTCGTNDLIDDTGDWFQANEAMVSALKAKKYGVTFLPDHGFHAFWSCGRALPEALRKLWADSKPAAKTDETKEPSEGSESRGDGKP